MRILAKAGPYEVIQELNGMISIYKATISVNRRDYVCDSGSAYETVVAVVKDPDIRKELIRQILGAQK